MLLRRDGSRFVNFDGTPAGFDDCIACCAAPDGSGWPLCSIAWVDHCADAGFNAVEFRLGPFMSTSEGPEWDMGPYAETEVTTTVPAGTQLSRWQRPATAITPLAVSKADLTKWNEEFWTEALRIAKHARTRKVRVLMGVDGWYFKDKSPNARVMPWLPQFNLQGEDHYTNAGRELDTVHQAFITKMVLTFGHLDNVVWWVGNETWLIPGYNPEKWTYPIRAHIREVEHQQGLPAHLFGGDRDSAAGDVDFVVLHSGGEPALAPREGKPTLVNEYNPSPPLTAAQLLTNHCRAQQAGTYYALWWDGSSQEAWDEARARWFEPCDSPTPPPTACTLGTPTARQAATDGKRPTVKVVFGAGKTPNVTPFACFGRAYCANAGWTDGRECCAVAPDGHPERLACEQHYLEAPCPFLEMHECTGADEQCPLTADPFYVINGTNQNHPANVAAGCRESTWQRNAEGRILKGEWWKATWHGKGRVQACNFDSSVCGVSGVIDF